MKYNSRIFLVLVGLCSVAAISGCADEDSATKNKTVYTPVFRNPELTVADYTADARAAKDLTDELKMPWNIKVSVQKTSGTEVGDVDSCNSILAADKDGLEPSEPAYHAAYQSALMQCRAIAIAAKMEPSNRTYLSGNLDQASVSEFPAAIAFVLSRTQRAIVDADTALETLDQVTPILGFTRESPYEVELDIDGGTQTILLMAKGDANGDRVEDLLIRVVNAASGGSYRATRLFVISKIEKDGAWLLVSEY